jgi:lysophospholipase L1-like esterase
VLGRATATWCGYGDETVLRRQIAWVLAAGVLLGLPGAAHAPAATPPAQAPLYISLGDSLAAGMQPDASGRDRPTQQGYVDVVADRLGNVHPGLHTARLSCGGATTGTLISGGAGCQAQGEPGQLVQAERLMAGHPETMLVTVNIGDNDVESCFDADPPGVDTACVHRGRVAIARNLGQIAHRLRAAAPAGARVIGILDYDQFLALWLRGPQGRTVARRSVRIIDSMNALMASVYRANGVEVADASQRFGTDDLADQRPLAGVGTVPLAVERICRWTYACGPRMDDHARPQGYTQIARAIISTLAH